MNACQYAPYPTLPTTPVGRSFSPDPLLTHPSPRMPRPPTLCPMNVESVNPTDLPEGAHLIDVREQGEWDAGHAENAKHLPASSLLENLDKLPEDDTVYVVCRSGGRSAQVTQWLNLNGFEAVNVMGGMDEWVESGLPIVCDGDAEPFII